MTIERAARLLLVLLLVGAALAACGPDAPAGGSAATYTGRIAAVDPDRGTVVLDLADDHAAGATTWAMAADARAEVLECTAVCAAVAVPVSALADGSARPHHGADALFEVAVVDDVVVGLAERRAP